MGWLRLRVTLAAADDRRCDKSQICKRQSNCESGTDEPVYIALFYTCCILRHFFYTILQDSINSLFSPFSITHSSKQLKPTNLPDLDAFWKANTFSCSKGLIFVL